jgi:hypothetical protein
MVRIKALPNPKYGLAEDQMRMFGKLVEEFFDYLLKQDVRVEDWVPTLINNLLLDGTCYPMALWTVETKKVKEIVFDESGQPQLAPGNPGEPVEILKEEVEKVTYEGDKDNLIDSLDETMDSEEDAFIHSKTLQENRILANFCLLSGIFDMYVNEPLPFYDPYPYIINMAASYKTEFCPPWDFVDFQEVMLNYQKTSTAEFEFDDCQLMTTGSNFGDIALLQTNYEDGMYDLLKLCRPVILFHLESYIDHYGEQSELKDLVTEENCDECAKDKDWNLFSLLTKLAFGKDSAIFFRIDNSDCFTLVDDK